MAALKPEWAEAAELIMNRCMDNLDRLAEPLYFYCGCGYRDGIKRFDEAKKKFPETRFFSVKDMNEIMNESHRLDAFLEGL